LDISGFQTGILIVGAARNRVRDLFVEGSSHGIALLRSAGNRIERNQAAPLGSDGNACVGIALFGAHGNAVEGNVAANNVHAGIHVRPRSRGTLVAANLARFNGGGDGIHVDNPLTTITANTADDNLDYGIEGVAGVTDGGGNTATGNGNPAQCLNVACS